MAPVEKDRLCRFSLTDQYMQLLKRGSPERATTLFVTLADNPDALRMPVYIPNLELYGFADPRPGVVQEQ